MKEDGDGKKTPKRHFHEGHYVDMVKDELTDERERRRISGYLGF